MYSNIIDKFEKAKVLVIGDLMLDKYVYGKVERINPEAPVPVLLVSSEKYVPGGAANVANNILSFGAKVFLVGVVGDDYAKKILMSELEKREIDCSGIVTSKKVQTTQKMRIIANNQQVVRVDYEDKYVDEDEEVCKNIRRLVPLCDIIIFSDYAKGAITKKIFEETKIVAKKYDKKIIVDPKPSSNNVYNDVYLVTPNKKEAEEITKMKISDDEDVKTALQMISKDLNSSVLITRGEEGMSLLDKNQNHFVNLPTRARKVFDVSGAGDTVIATLALSIASNANLVEACEIANHAAGIVVGKLETATTNKEELLSLFNLENKEIKTLDQIKKISEDLKSNGKKVIFTNGCFDILHSGHVSLLQKAKTFGDVLIVGINSDSTIKKLKGEGRPIFNQEERLEIISALECVDHVVLFKDMEPSRLISLIKPDVHVKGGDYDPNNYENMPEAKVVKEYGGDVKIIKLLEGKSTTNVVKKMELL